MNESDSKIKIGGEKKKDLIGDIKSFFLDNRDEEIGDLQAELLIDLLVKNVGVEIYNQALNDALIWLKAKLSDVEIDYYSLEKKKSE